MRRFPSISPLRLAPRPRAATISLILAACALALAALPVAALASAAPPAAARLLASPEPGWPQFRGPQRDGHSPERGLLPAWPESGPPLRWSAPGAGRGFSSPIIGGGRLYVTGDFADETRILAYSLEGRPLWSVVNGASWLNQYQGARASVTFYDGRLYHQNAHGRLVCLDAATGRELWHLDVLARWGGENITWGLSECLLVDDRAVYVTAGSRSAWLAALDRRTGAVLWTTPSPVAPDAPLETATYAAPILFEFAGRRLLAGCTKFLLYCVDPATGALQWTRPRPTTYAVLASSPVLVGDALFMTAPFGAPGQLYRLLAPAAPGEKIGVADAWTTALDTCQGGVVHLGGRLYGSTYPRRGSWQALDAATGKLLHETTDFAKGAVLAADGRLYVLAEDGWLLLLEPVAEKFEVRGRIRLPGTRDRDRDVWAHPALVDGRLYLRYHDTLFCYDVRAPR